MQFRLIYQGPLPAETSRPRTKYKHLIRQQFHKQIRELYHRSNLLSDYYLKRTAERVRDGEKQLVPLLEIEADKHARCGYRFVPFINEGQGVACSLDILFLRRDGPGNLIRSGGDIDNRLKVLFDGMRMPGNCDELKGMPPEDGEDPFFCLMEDDALITEVKVTTDRLLIPPQDAEREHDVHLVIDVHTRIVDPKLATLDFWL